jgi:superfamily II DNA or RNA helicase
MGERVLFLAHRRRLIQQAIEKIGTHPRFLAQTVQGFNTDAGQFGLIVTDEAHHVPAETYQAIYKANPDALLLGLTATPVRGDGSGLGADFDHMVQTVSARQLIDDGWLAGIRLFVPETAIDTSEVRSNQNGDFSLSGLGKLVRNEETARHAVGEYRRHADGLRGIVFCVDRSHARMQNAAYLADGVRSVYMDGETPELDERRIFNAWANREIDVICNCQLFTEGLDLPEVDFIQILRPTQSLPLYFQMIGRGMRPGDEPMRLLDHTLNWQFHGLPDEHGRAELPKVEPLQVGQVEVTDILPDNTPVSGFKLVTGKDDGGPVVRHELRRERIRDESGEVVETGRYVPRRSANLVEFEREQKRAEALKLFKEQPELSNRQIAKFVGVSDEAVGNWRNAAGLSSPVKYSHPEQKRAEALRLLKEQPDLSSAKIGKLLNVDASTIRRWCRATGIPGKLSSFEKKEKALQLFNEKPALSNREIAEMVGVERSAVLRWKKEAGLSPPIGDALRQKKAEVLRLFKEQPELSSGEIAKISGASVTSVREWRSNLGFPAPPNKYGRKGPAQKVKALKLFDEQPNMTNQQIAKIVGASDSSIGKWRRDYNASKLK